MQIYESYNDKYLLCTCGIYHFHWIKMHSPTKQINIRNKYARTCSPVSTSRYIKYKIKICIYATCNWTVVSILELYTTMKQPHL